MRPMMFRLILLSATPLAAATAQEGPAGVTALDAVTATATRTPEVAGDVAAPVSVVPREEIQRRQPQNLNDLLRDMPGVEADGLPRNSVMQPQIRGLGDDRIVIRLDGARQNFSSGHRGRLFLDPLILRQVDVLRGPGSLLYGSGALGGVIAFRTVDAADLLRPGETVTGIVSGGYQSANDQWLGSLTSAFRSGPVDGLANVIGRTGKNYRDGAGQSIPYSAADTVTGLAKLGWTVGGGLRLGLSALGFGENTTIPTAANTTTTNNIAKRRLRQQQLAVTAEYTPEGSDWFDAHTTAYYTDVGIDERRVVPDDGRFDTTDYTTFGLDLQNSSRFGLGAFGRHTLTYGVDMFRDEQEGTRNNAPRTEFPKADQTIIGLYMQDAIAFGPVTLTLGLRYDHYDQSAENQASRSDSRVSPKASLAWQITDWVAPYVAYTEAFRAPGLSELYPTGVHFALGPNTFNFFVPNPDLRPEIAKNKEIGVNFRFRDVLRPRDSLRARLSMFQTDFDDFIELVVTQPPPPMNGTTQARNVSRARIRGVEFEAGYDSGTWFGTFAASALDGDNRTDDQPLSMIPAHKASITAGYRFLETGLVVGGRVLLAATQDEKPPPSYPTSGYGLVDLFASWEPVEGPLVGWRLDVGIDNLFDHAYRRLSWDSGASPSDFYDVGRNVKFALRTQF
jgi:hemoglobin/transferrin/lactoferrin receptor protein